MNQSALFSQAGETMGRPDLIPRDVGFGDSVFTEITRNFPLLLKLSRQILGNQHVFTTVCVHACVFPTDRMSLKMVWDQFQALPVAERAEILQQHRKLPINFS